VSIRKADIHDASGIAASSHGLGYSERSIGDLKHDLAWLLCSGRDQVWVYEADGIVAGWLHAFISIRVASPSFAEIGGLAVAPSFTRKGIGRELVSRAVDWAKSQGLKIRVRCSASRLETHSFYRGLGFSELKSQLVFERKL
jgi:GNAT superfamily N-acetyltransferase